MSLVPVVKDTHNPAIDNLIQASLESKDEWLILEWIPCSQITDIKSAQTDNFYYAIHKRTGGVKSTTVVLVLLGNDESCTPTCVSEFARIYSLPTHNYNNIDASQYKRYTIWLTNRNKLIMGFTEYDDNYYMVADARFHHYYPRYGFCVACGIFRCSPVWCICGHKQLSDGWTSNNKRLDDFIKKSQLQTNSANDAYLEWIPGDCINIGIHSSYLHDLPVPNDPPIRIDLIEIADETHDLCYAELCDKHPDILCTSVWITIGFTYNASKQKYCLIQKENGCLACTVRFVHRISAFCLTCKAPRPLNWTTGNKSLDLFIMESWHNTTMLFDAYIQWIEYSLLLNVQEMQSLRHGCTRIANWLESTKMGLTRVALKKIVIEGDEQSFNFHRLTKEYPEILIPDNIWIIGIAQEPSTREYYLVFYYDVHAIVDRFIRLDYEVYYLQYDDFYKFKEIGSDGHATFYTAKYRRYLQQGFDETVALKRFKRFDETYELFISEFKNHAKCSFFQFYHCVYGVTQVPETNEYMIVMQHANHGLLSYLDQNINNLTWETKLSNVLEIATDLYSLHSVGVIHCNIHSGNIGFYRGTLTLCDLSLSRSVKSDKLNSTIRGGLPFIAPEVFRTRKFTKESDVYSFGVIMYLMATGELPFRNRQFDKDFWNIMGRLQLSMPDSAPEEYKKIAKWCCDADPDKRPDAYTLVVVIEKLFEELDRDSNAWNTIYNNNVKTIITSGEGK